MHKVAIVVTTYTGGQESELKSRMTKTLCKRLSELRLFDLPFHVCLVSHSPIDIETQNYCHSFIYDADNSFQINGLPVDNLTHGMAELKSVHNAVNYLKRFGFTHFFKLTYDCDPTLDFVDIIKRAVLVCEEQKKSMVCSGWGIKETIGFLMFYCKLDFFSEAFPLTKPEVWHANFEMQSYNVVESLGLIDQVYQHHNTYDNFLGYQIRDFAHQGGTEFEQYNFS